MSPDNVIFLDTSILIARKISGPEIKRQIAEQLERYDFTATSLVVRNEYRRRLLKEAKYLLGLLKDKKSILAVRRHVQDTLTQHHSRKKNICLGLILAFEEGFTEIDQLDNEATKSDRLKMFLESLLDFGLYEFDSDVDLLIRDSSCACGLQEVTLDRKGIYNLGYDKCSKLCAECEIGKFLEKNKETLEMLLETIQELDSFSEPKKTDELKNTDEFITKYLAKPNDVEKLNPCLAVGDLLITLESIEILNFYTMNWKESQVLSKALGQNLVYRSTNEEREDQICLCTSKKWGPFNRQSSQKVI